MVDRESLSAEGLVVGAVGALVACIGIVAIMVAGILLATAPDPTKLYEDDDRSALDDFNNRMEWVSDLYNLALPAIPIGAVGAVAGASLVRRPAVPVPMRFVGYAVLVVMGVLLWLAYFMEDATVRDGDWLSAGWRAWKWTEVVGWLGVAVGVACVAIGSMRDETPPAAFYEVPAPVTEARFDIRAR